MARLAQTLVAIAMLVALPAGAYVTGAIIGPPPRAVDPPAETPAEATSARDGDDAAAAAPGRRSADRSGASGTSGAAETSRVLVTSGAATPAPEQADRTVRGRSAPTVDHPDRGRADRARGHGADRAPRGVPGTPASPARAADTARSAQAEPDRSPTGTPQVAAPQAAAPKVGDVASGAASVPGPPPGRGRS